MIAAAKFEAVSNLEGIGRGPALAEANISPKKVDHQRRVLFFPQSRGFGINAGDLYQSILVTLF